MPATLAEPHTVVEVVSLPVCDLCAANGIRRLAAVDGKTVSGPWANLCVSCHRTEGCGLGLGLGQRLQLRDASSLCACGHQYGRHYRGRCEVRTTADGPCPCSSFEESYS